jgi:glycosyltransferase involved in cell wall biosynthesis
VITQPVFSVIIPVYNRPVLLRQAAESVFAQTYPAIEIVVVDDGSTDDTPKAILALKREAEKRGVVLTGVTKANGGASSARNAGVGAATGAYLQFLDSDDRLHPKRLSRLAGVFQETGADFIFTGFDGFDPLTGETVETHVAPAHLDPHDRALKGKFWGNSLRCAYRAELIARMGPWDETLDVFEDREYAERGLFLADKVIAVPEVLAHARRGGGDRLSDQLRSKAGRANRIECERRLLALARQSGRARPEALSAFASRLYGLGVRSYAEGWIEHGRACGAIARASGARLDAKGRQRQFAWRMGVVGGRLYGFLGRLIKGA